MITPDGPDSDESSDDSTKDFANDESITKNCHVASLYDLPQLKLHAEANNIKINEADFLKASRKRQRILTQGNDGQCAKKIHVQWNEQKEFEVETIISEFEAKEDTYYLIHWKGWSHESDTWENEKNLSCDKPMKKFKKQMKMLQENDMEKYWSEVSRAKRLFYSKIKAGSSDDTFASSQDEATTQFEPGSADYKKRKQEQKKAIKAWEKELNLKCSDPAMIVVENNVDLEGPPSNFQYVNDYVVGEGVVISDEPIVGCNCGNGCLANKEHCCSEQMGLPFAYDRWGRAKEPEAKGFAIYECNKRCACDSTCKNRVVQNGRKVKVAIYRTESKGWGVKALTAIKKGTFITEYVGEVITFEEAEVRGKEYDLQAMTYLFDLDYQQQGNAEFTVDAGNCGNISHFINHSCDPNLAIYCVWINNLDPRMPRIAMFALENICRGDELTFDYQMTGESTVNRSFCATSSEKRSGLQSSLSLMLSEKADLPPPSTPNSSNLPMTPSSCSIATDSPVKENASTPLKVLSSLVKKVCSLSMMRIEPALKSEKGADGKCMKLEVDKPLLDNTPDSEKETGARRQLKFETDKTSTPSTSNLKHTKCHCGTKNCRGWLY